VAALLAGVLVTTCADNPTAPNRPGFGSVSLQPGFDQYALFAPVVLNQVRAVVVRPPSDTVVDTLVTFRATDAQLQLTLRIPLQATSETMGVGLQLLAGNVLLFTGSEDVVVRQGTTSQPTSVPMTYAGPGANATSLELAPDTTLRVGSTAQMRATALDIEGVDVGPFYLNWSIVGTAPGASIDATGLLHAPTSAGTFFVRGITPGGLRDSVQVTAIPAPSTLAKSAGDGQSGTVGTRLANPLVVLVTGAGGVPVPGVTVSFAATTGGGIVDSATATTNAQGLALSGVVLGATVGAQSFTVSSTGLAPVVFSATAQGLGPQTRTWNGAVSTDFSLAGNWVGGVAPAIGDGVIIGAATNQPSLTATTTVGSVTINSGGALTVNGQTMIIAGDLTTAGTGVLRMLTSSDGVGVTGNAVFGGGDESGLLIAGALQIGGNFSQTSGTSSGSFRATGSHTTAFTGAAPSVTFASPAAATSSFQNLAWTTSGASSTMTLGSAVFAKGSFSTAGTGGTGLTSTNGSRLTVQGDFASVLPLVLNNVPVTIDQATTSTIFVGAGLTFQNMATTVSQLVIRNPGLGAPVALAGLTFGTVPTAPNGFYLDVTDVAADANVLTLDLTGAAPASGGAFVRTAGGAVVNWPPVAGVTTWTGAVSTDWSVAGNWSGGVPGATDSAVVAAATNAPRLTTTTSVGALTITGGVLQINGNGITVARNLTITGGGILMSDADDQVVVGGDAIFGGADASALLTGGELTIGGNFTQLSSVSPFSFAAGGSHITLFTSGPHTISFASPGAPSGSGFADLEFAGNGTVSFSTATWVRGTLDVNAAGQVFSSPNGSRLGVELLVATAPVTFNNVPLVINQTQQTSITNQPLTFQNMATNVVQLEINHPGSSSPLTLNGFVFSTVPVAPNGFYLSANDNSADANPLVINMTSATPAAGAPFIVTTGGATVNWAGSSTVRTWTGAVSTDWSTAGNWSNGVPQSSDDVVIDDNAVQEPTLSTSATIRNLTFTTEGATVRLTVADPAVLSVTGNILGSVRVLGDVVLTGGATHQIGGELGQLTTGDPVTVVNAVSFADNLLISGGQFDLRGTQVFLTGDLNLGGTGTIQTDDQSFFSINGNATFGGGPTTGLLQGGTIIVRKDFAVTGANAGFAPANGTSVLLNGTTAQQVSFANATSFFDNLDISNSNGPITLANDITVKGTLGSGQPGTRLVGTGLSVNVGGELNMSGVTFDGVRLVYTASSAAALVSMNNTTFNNYTAAAPQLEINHPGAAQPIALDGLVFSGTANPYHLQVNDNNVADGVGLTVNLTNATPADGTGLFNALNGATVGWPPAPTAWAWTGAVSTDWSNAANWNPAAVPTATSNVTIGAAPNQPTLTADATVNSVVISTAGARLTLGGHTLTVQGNFTTHTDGLLVSTNPADRLIVGGSAAFQGGDETGLITAGELRLNGDFTQQVQTSPLSFLASGSHRTVMTNASQFQTVRFCCTANTSKFMNLDISQSFGINIQFAANGVFVADTFIAQPGAGPRPWLYMLGSPLTARRFKINRLLVDRGTLTLNEGGVAGTQQLDSVTFQNYLPTQTQLALIAVGSASTARVLTFTNLVFQTLNTGDAGRYLNATSTANALTIDLTTANVTNGASFTTVAGGAAVNWPGPPASATWTGAVSTAWADPGNWSGGAVPGSITAVTIPAGTPFAPTAGAVASTAGNLTVSPGATLTLASPFNLTVSGNVDAQGAIGPTSQTLSLNGANVTLRGNVPQLTVTGIVTLNGNTTAASNGPCVFNGTAELVVNGFTFTCFQLQFNNTARLQMTNAADSVVVLGSTQFFGGSTLGRLTAGVLDLRGSFQQLSTNSITSFASTGTRVRIGGSATSTVSMQNGGSGTSRFTALLVNKTGGALTLSGPVVALDSVTLTSVTNITGSALLITPRLRVPAGAGVQLSQLQVNGNTLSIGTPASYNVATTVLDGSGGPQTIPVLPYQTLYLRGGVPHLPAGRITTSSALFVVGGSLVLNGGTVETGAGFIVDSTGALIMSNATDSLLVGGNAFFQQSVDATGNLTAGVLRIASSMSVATANAFVASGTHKTIFTSPLSYTVHWTGIGAVPIPFQDLEVQTTNGTSTSFNWARVNGAMTVTGNGGINADELEVRGQLTTSPASGMGLNKLTLGGATPIAPGSGFINARLWVLDAVGPQTMPLIPAPSGPDSSAIIVRSQTGFTSDMTLNGLRIEGDGILEINEQTVDVFGDFATADNGRLFMQYPLSRLNITGATTFGGGNENGALTAGILTVSGRFTQVGTNSSASFRAIGDHITRIATNYPGGNSITFGNPGLSGFQHLELAVPVTWASDVEIYGDFTNTAAGAMSPGQFTVRGTFTQSGNSAFTPRHLIFHGPAFNVTNGSLAPDTVEFRNNSSAFVWPVGARYTWNHAIADASAIVTLGATAPTIASLSILGVATLNLNNQALTVNGTFTSNSSQVYGQGTSGRLEARRFQVTDTQLDDVQMVLDEQGTAQTQQFDNVTFQNYPTSNARLLQVTAVGAAGPRQLTFSGVTFPSPALPGGQNNLYVSTTSSNALPYQLNIGATNVDAATGPGFTSAGGPTTVVWP
jgi:hypothetical protein